ncbi:hypothetical protein [Streptomyces sp. WAC07149]|uniref:hypothetical protein n=1 Tax=Streptomyces sp. WAC07149 TaxID=2487425 RepID=UPI000F7A6E79|nr:hypothetical protein [Streptomyces sp. WAC07149]
MPRQYDERKVLASTVDAWGRALWLICEDARFQPQPHGWRSVEPPELPFDALLVIRDGAHVRERTLNGVATVPRQIDAPARDEFVLYGFGRGDRDPRDGQIFDRRGRSRRRFAMGSGLLHMAADGRANLWTGYNDEGIYGDPIGAGALVRWDTSGNRQHGFHPPKPYHVVVGIDALNVTDSVVRTAYSGPGSPLAELRAGEPIRIRELPVADAWGLAVRDDRLLLLGGAEPGTARVHLRQVHHCRLTDGGAVITGRGELTWPNGDPVRRYTRPVGRGPHLYVRNRPSMRQWYVLSVP